MATLISNDRLEKHAVKKYNFKVLASESSDMNEAQTVESYSEDDNPSRRTSDVDASSMTTSSKEALIESLMKKTDEMSSNFIKLQMKLESKEEEYEAQLQKTKEVSFSEGLKAGIQQAIDDSKTDLSKGIEQFGTSVSTLENTAKEFEVALESIKSDLITAAVDIAKEVVSMELLDNSNEVAKKLGDSLIKELQSAAKITLKVNPKDHGAISQHVGSLKHIEIVSDSAVSEGGVIAISDAGNIDAQISKRFERVKKSSLK
ncbi:MAG: flagellar assembly protein FliH [Sulfurimonas sp.]|nr:flagellar assembly protein FliH [Sulfurimonas sp.]